MRQGRLALALLALAFAAAPAAGAKDKGYRGRIAFEGSALLVTYYSGVHQALLERGALVPGETQLAGLSGGGYSSVGATLGKTGLEMRDVWKGIVAGCAAQFAGGCVGHLNAYIVAHLLDALPEDAHKTASKTVNILVSQLDGNNNDSLANSASWTLDKFKNKADLISALTSTNYIPCYSGMTLFNFHRNEPVIDGGYSSGFKELCLKAKGGDCLKVASYHVGPLGDATCDPALCPVLAQSNCIEAARLETTTKLYKNDKYVDRQPVYHLLQRCPTSDWNGSAPLPPFVPQDQVLPDIFPGKYNPLPMWDGKRLLACQWHEWAFNPGGAPGRGLEAMDVMYDLGYADGNSWASANGYPACN